MAGHRGSIGSKCGPRREKMMVANHIIEGIEESKETFYSMWDLEDIFTDRCTEEHLLDGVDDNFFDGEIAKDPAGSTYDIGCLDDFDPFMDEDDDFLLEGGNGAILSDALPEIFWSADDVYDKEEGIGWLRYYMEDVKPNDIENQSPGWLAQKYSILVSAALVGIIPESTLLERSFMYGRYMKYLTETLHGYGVEVKFMEGLTPEMWKIVKKIDSSIVSN